MEGGRPDPCISDEEIVAGDDVYGGSDQLLSRVTPKSGVVVKCVDTTNLEVVASAVGPWTKLVWLESLTNPRQKISDIQKIAEIAHAHGSLILVDNNVMSPVLSQPLELGADIVKLSCTLLRNSFLVTVISWLVCLLSREKAWQKSFASCRMLRVLGWLHSTIGFV